MVPAGVHLLGQGSATLVCDKDAEAWLLSVEAGSMTRIEGIALEVECYGGLHLQEKSGR